MKNIKKDLQKTAVTRNDFFEPLWEKSWTYIRTVVDVVREPVLVLDKDFRVIAANDPFYRAFQVKAVDTENKIVYELGNGQWDIPALRKLLEDILPKNTFFKGFEVTHEFPNIGKKVMILNARQIYFEEDTFLKGYGPLELSQHIILLAIEDITEMMAVAEMLAKHTKEFEFELTERTKKMEVHIEKLREEIEVLKKKPSTKAPRTREQKKV
jgi:PAS domain-containing protein